MFAIYSIRLYMFVFMFWNIITKTIKKPELTLIENMYIQMSQLCKMFADVQITTTIDEVELYNNTKMLQLYDGRIYWYPITKQFVKVDDIVTRWYLIIKSPLENADMNINETDIDKTDKIYMWFPINETFVRLDENLTKWVPVNESFVRRRRHNSMIPWHTIDASSLEPDEKLFKWFPMNDSLIQVLVDTSNKYPSDDNMIKWYPINESLVRLDDDKIRSSPIHESLIHLDHSNTSNTKSYLKNDDPFDVDTTINWYPVNKSYITIKRPNINIAKTTKLIIHGFSATAEDGVTLNLALAYYKQNTSNVLLIDAQAMLGKIYFKCVSNARLLGKAIADIIIYLETFGADAADFHLLGVSLGAHVAGWAGMYFRLSKGRRIGRITGLDPARPCFAYKPANERLDKTDAMYVDVIHTNAFVEGLFEPVGHADFYVNGGGPFQPGCFWPPCSHMYAANIFAASIKHPELFVSVKCNNWLQFQENKCTNKTAWFGDRSFNTRGLYFIRTSGKSPYGLGLEGIISDEKLIPK